jgi:hypothetical protein
MSAAEHFSSRYNTSDIPGPDGQAVSSSTAVLSPHGQGASSTSTGPGPNGQMDFSSSSTVTGRRPPAANGGQPAAKPGGRLASQLPFFFQFLLQCYQGVVNPSKVLPASSHGVVYHLRTTGTPITSPFQWLDAEKLVAAKADFMKMEVESIIRRSSSPWASPLHLVKKPYRSWGPCCSFGHLTDVTVPDTYSVIPAFKKSKLVTPIQGYKLR